MIGIWMLLRKVDGLIAVPLYVMLKDGFKPDHFAIKSGIFLSTKDENLNSVLTIQRYSDRHFCTIDV